MKLKNTNRRTVLKTIGAGVVGGTVMIGPATASSHDFEILMKDGDEISEVGEYRFEPRNASVGLGSDGSVTVRWTNQGSHVHDVAFNQLDIDGPDVLPGKSWEKTFTQTFEDSYKCTYHPNMRASLRVTE